jgi:FliG middle domain
MHRLFQPLERQHVSLLLTLLSQGSHSDLSLLDYWDDPVVPTIKEKAAMLAQIPGDKRAMFIAVELKKLVSEPSARGLEQVDATWIVQALENEEPRTVAAILVSLPANQLKAVVEKLPLDLRRRLPPKDEMKAISPHVVRTVRLAFERRFSPMPISIDRGFTFRDIILLESKELGALLRNLGLEELAQAFVSVGRYALAELCKRLPREYAEELIATVKRVKSGDAMELKSAQRFLGRVLTNFNDTEELSRKAGLYRLSKALSIESQDYLQAFYQRLPKSVGELLESYIQKVSEMSETDDDRARRLQDGVLRAIQDMAKANQISQRHLEHPFVFHSA